VESTRRCREAAVFLCALVAFGVSPLTAGTAEAALDPGVQGVTAEARVTAASSDVIVAWTPATAKQRRGLSWTAVYLSNNPQPDLVFTPAISDIIIPDVPPGTYGVSVEFAYGARSNYTHTARGTTTVTVAPYHLKVGAPLAPTCVIATATGQSVTVAWSHNLAETARQHPDSYVVAIGTTMVTVVNGYGRLTARFSDAAAGEHPVTVTARNDEGDSPVASGGPVVVTRLGSPDQPVSPTPARRPGTLFESVIALTALGIIWCVTSLVRS
jgi:hypothetical protein